MIPCFVAMHFLELYVDYFVEVSQFNHKILNLKVFWKRQNTLIDLNWIELKREFFYSLNFLLINFPCFCESVTFDFLEIDDGHKYHQKLNIFFYSYYTCNQFKRPNHFFLKAFNFSCFSVVFFKRNNYTFSIPSSFTWNKKWHNIRAQDLFNFL